MKYRRGGRSYRFLWVLVIPLAGVLSVFGWKSFVKLNSRTRTTVVDTGGTTQEPVSLSMRAMLVGDMDWSGKIDEKAMASREKEKYLFAQTDTLSRTNFDIWVGALDCNISAGESAGQTFCKPSYLKEMSKWIDAVSVAGSSVGADSEVFTTRSDLDKNSFNYFGSPEQSTRGICSAYAMPARYRIDDGTYKQSTLPIALCGVNFAVAGVSVDLRTEIDKYSKFMPVWAYNSSATKSQPGLQPNDIQRAVAHDLINSGVDVVVGAGGSNIQAAEVYNGHLILHSLGDFLKDKLSDSSTDTSRFGLGLGLVIEVPTDKNVFAWVDLAKGCQPFTDTCLDQAKKSKLERPDYAYKYSLCVVDTNGGRPKKAVGSDFDKVSHLLEWNSLDLKGLVQN
jgi:hypothetical protein